MRRRKLVLKIKEMLIERLLLFCSLLSVFTTAGIILVLASETLGFFREVSF
jgi:phosphate transport system permease protein